MLTYKQSIILTFILLLFGIRARTLAEDKEPSAKDILGMWHFDEGQGEVAKDSSGNGNNLRLAGATWTEGRKGKCLSFDGKGSCAFLEKLSPELELSCSEFTISCWIKPEYEYPQTMLILSNAPLSASPGFRFGFYYGLLEFCSGDGKKFWNVRTPKFKDGKIPGKALQYGAWFKGIISSRWYYIAVTYKDGLYTIYVDGRIVCEKKEEAVFPAKHRLVIGNSNPKDPNSSYKDLIDELEILQRAKSGKEIIAEVFPGEYF